MKKLNSILCCLVLALACVLLVGCGKSGIKPQDMSNSAYVGTWKATLILIAGEEVPAEEAVDSDIIMTLNADGTATFTSEGSVSDGVWNETGKGIKLEGEELNVEFTDKDGALEGDILLFKMLFEKQ